MKQVINGDIYYFLKGFIIILLIFSFVSCRYNCNYNFYIDNGTNSDDRFTIIKELDYAMFIGSSDTSLEVSFFTGSTNNLFVKNRGVEFKLNELFLLFKNTNDTLYSNDQYKTIFSCENFKENSVMKTSVFLKPFITKSGLIL